MLMGIQFDGKDAKVWISLGCGQSTRYTSQTQDESVRMMQNDRFPIQSHILMAAKEYYSQGEKKYIGAIRER